MNHTVMCDKQMKQGCFVQLLHRQDGMVYLIMFHWPICPEDFKVALISMNKT